MCIESFTSLFKRARANDQPHKCPSSTAVLLYSLLHQLNRLIQLDQLIRSYRPIAHLCTMMWGLLTKFAFRLRSTLLLDDEAEDIDTTSFVPEQEGAPREMSVRTEVNNNNHRQSGNYHRAISADHNFADIVERHILSGGTSFADRDFSLICPSPPSVNADKRFKTFYEPSELDRRGIGWELPSNDCHQRDNYDQQLMNKPGSRSSEPAADVQMRTNLRRHVDTPNRQTSTHAALPERTYLEVILMPVRDKLQALKATTPESLPQYNPRMRTNCHAQVLKRRLLPIGDFIVQVLAQSPTERRGRLELQLCRFIASGYWPLPVTEVTPLRVQETYRNGILKRNSCERRMLRAAVPERDSHNFPTQKSIHNVIRQA